MFTCTVFPWSACYMKSICTAIPKKECLLLPRQSISHHTTRCQCHLYLSSLCISGTHRSRHALINVCSINCSQGFNHFPASRPPQKYRLISMLTNRLIPKHSCQDCSSVGTTNQSNMLTRKKRGEGGNLLYVEGTAKTAESDDLQALLTRRRRTVSADLDGEATSLALGRPGRERWKRGPQSGEDEDPKTAPVRTEGNGRKITKPPPTQITWVQKGKEMERGEGKWIREREEEKGDDGWRKADNAAGVGFARRTRRLASGLEWAAEIRVMAQRRRVRVNGNWRATRPAAALYMVMGVTGPDS